MSGRIDAYARLMVRFIKIETLEAPAVRVAGRTVTPVSRRLTVALARVGFIRSSPLAVVVRDGPSTRRVAVHDWTRMAQAAVFVLGVAGYILIRHCAAGHRAADEQRRG